jgi:2-polyprenyl-3-methyl-5-hydroxy-6-metoxy-1,4-benzoquinol methylase
MDKWKQAQSWEQEWWGDCVNSLNEELKQLTYAQKMGLVRSPSAKTPYRFDLGGLSVLDIGGGPVSLLLKCINFSRAKVVDPLRQPEWVLERYKLKGVEYEQKKGEKIAEEGWDEVWTYNTLQHCENPKVIIENGKKAGNLIRIFEWLDVPIVDGHINNLTESNLNEWLEGIGKVEQLNNPPAMGKAYFGIFV